MKIESSTVYFVNGLDYTNEDLANQLIIDIEFLDVLLTKTYFCKHG